MIRSEGQKNGATENEEGTDRRGKGKGKRQGEKTGPGACTIG